MSTSMMRPMPFCPSFEPWAKLTPVQVKMSKLRIHRGGGFWPCGGSNSSGRLAARRLVRASNRPAPAKPISGLISRDRMTSCALPQLTPAPSAVPVTYEPARPTPSTAPMSVCDEDAGRPRYQVPRFQMTAASSSDATISSPARCPRSTSSSTGSRCTIENATASPVVVAYITPTKFHRPDHVTACPGFNECVYMTVATALEVSWKPLTNSKPNATARLTIRMTRPAEERSDSVDAMVYEG